MAQSWRFFFGLAFFRHELDYQIQEAIYKPMRSHLLTQVIHFDMVYSSYFTRSYITIMCHSVLDQKHHR